MKVFWDTMLFIYLLDEHPVYLSQVLRHLENSLQNGDVLVTSCLAIGEALSGGRGIMDRQYVSKAEAYLNSLPFDLLRFDSACISTFARLRSESGVHPADAIHLACASVARVDVFSQLLKRC